MRSQDQREQAKEGQSLGLTFAEASEMYLRLKGSNKPKTFHSAVERALSYVVKVIGNKPLHANSRDDARWLLALISDTGMRLSEALGLSRDDTRLSEDIPHILIRPHSWWRLKTIGSKRKVPLIGSALWAAQRIMKGHDSSLAFPSFCNGQVLKSNAVSANLNRWLKLKIGDEYVIHSLRQSLRDRLRAVDYPYLVCYPSLVR